jgi:hypothetical protein
MPAPITRAKIISRTKPRIRLTRVSPPIVPPALTRFMRAYPYSGAANQPSPVPFPAGLSALESPIAAPFALLLLCAAWTCAM